MASTKASLKAINDTIRQQKWDEALTQTESLIAKDPKNYQAYAMTLAYHLFTFTLCLNIMY